eukprot:m.198073 g.198073  ORF g.198073 m.198073 type:complete len:181 (+) comp21870_c0_seq8:297-839(+)
MEVQYPPAQRVPVITSEIPSPPPSPPWRPSLKEIVIVLLILYVMWWFTTSGPSKVASLISSAGKYAAAFGSIWVVLALLSFLLPVLGPILSHLFNRARNYSKQKENLDKVVDEVQEKTGKEVTSEDLDKLSQEKGDLLEEATAADNAAGSGEGTSGQSQLVDALSDIVEKNPASEGTPAE